MEKCWRFLGLLLHVTVCNIFYFILKPILFCPSQWSMMNARINTLIVKGTQDWGTNVTAKPFRNIAVAHAWRSRDDVIMLCFIKLKFAMFCWDLLRVHVFAAKFTSSSQLIFVTLLLPHKIVLNSCIHAYFIFSISSGWHNSQKM